MVRSKICLTDVNVWIALAAERHEHHTAARDWFESLEEHEAVFCRVTQMGFLRLLTNRSALREDVLNPMAAWDRYRTLRRDWRVTFAGEPAAMERTWIHLMRLRTAPGAWTDAYLAAFALGHGYRFVSFDRGFSHWKDLRFTLLLPARR